MNSEFYCSVSCQLDTQKEKGMSSANYKFLKKFDAATMNEGKRLPPQLQLILDHIEKAGKTGISQEELVKQLSDGNKLNTRQPVERVINFYHQRMRDLNLVEVQKTTLPKTIPAKGATVVVAAPGAPAQQVGAKAPV